MSSIKKRNLFNLVLSSEERKMLEYIAKRDLRDLSHEVKFLITERYMLLASNQHQSGIEEFEPHSGIVVDQEGAKVGGRKAKTA